jgi:uncharacterized membrane protein
MSGKLLANWPWFAATLVVALAVHLASVVLLPHVVMSRALDRLTRRADFNTISHGTRPNSDSRAIVRPSPDLLYSTCPYDLSRGPLLVWARVPRGTYWSVSAFDANTNNFFVRNDRQAANGEVHLVLTPPDQDKQPVVKGAIRVSSPTMRGLVLIRTLINDDANLPEIDAERRQARCDTWRASRTRQ